MFWERDKAHALSHWDAIKGSRGQEQKRRKEKKPQDDADDDDDDAGSSCFKKHCNLLACFAVPTLHQWTLELKQKLGLFCFQMTDS